MSWLYRTCLRPMLFAQDSEDIHNLTLRALGSISRQKLLCEALASFYGSPKLSTTLWGLRFPNPVGLAAGMDKEAQALPAWRALGFGFSELGGVTWRAQPGNPRPRIFRAIPDEALVNRMGFNNPGAEEIAAKLSHWRRARLWPDHPIGINLGKSKITPLEQAGEDYANSLRALWNQADFFVVNVSSPNTPNLRQLQDKAALDEILASLQEVNRKCSADAERRIPLNDAHPSESSPGGFAPKPILVKVAPDLSREALDDILDLVRPRNIAGIIATNTTTSRPSASDEPLRRVYAETGGLSGKPLRERSTEVVRHLYCATRGALPIVGVGGIFTAADAWEKITAGATLVQVYTGLVYEGPGIASSIVRGLRERLEEHGFHTLAQAVGLDAGESSRPPL
jgi:dihydroorotate dehydrogenase